MCWMVIKLIDNVLAAFDEQFVLVNDSMKASEYGSVLSSLHM